jgi:protein TonB
MALGISLSTILFVFFLMRIEKPLQSSGPLIDKGDVIVRTVEIPKTVKSPTPPPVKKVPEQVFKQKQFTQLVIVNKEPVTPPPDIRDLTTSLISNKTLEGRDATNVMPVINETVPVAIQKGETVAPKEPPIQKEPEFPGGVAAWMNFLQKNLIAPDELEPGQTKTVAIRFSVSPEGIVTDFEIVRSAGAKYDSEVIRVLKKMPRWKPAIQNGQPVARSFTQPVTFMGLEQ